jgi:hypothetical protein
MRLSLGQLMVPLIRAITNSLARRDCNKKPTSGISLEARPMRKTPAAPCGSSTVETRRMSGRKRNLLGSKMSEKWHDRPASFDSLAASKMRDELKLEEEVHSLKFIFGQFRRKGTEVLQCRLVIDEME